MLRDWVTGQVEQQSDSVYRLAVGHTRFVWSLRRFTVDSILLTTDSATNARRSAPRSGLTVLMRDCTVGGVSLSRLLLRRGIHATRLGCTSIAAAVRVAPRTVTVLAQAPDQRRPPGGFLVLQRRLELPTMVPRIRVRRVSFPNVSLVLDRPAAFGGVSHFELGQLTWSASELVIDPDDVASTARPLFSQSAEIVAHDLELHPDTSTLLTVLRLRVSLSDSLIELREVSWEPHGTNIEVARAGPYRRDPMRVRVARVDASGVDLDALVAGFATRARRISLDSLDLELYSDKRMPKHPTAVLHRTPQQWLAALRAEVSVDSLEFRNTRFVYQERRPGYDRNALLTFTNVNALATSARHVPGRRTGSKARDAVPGPDVMTIRTESVFEGEGRLALTFTIPVDAATFEMTFDGTLQSMPASALNPLVETTQPARISGGMLDGLALRGTVENGTARGVVTVRYHDLSLQVTGQGKGGLIQSGGLLGGFVRTIATVQLNAGRIRQDNPARNGGAPRTGVISHQFTPTQTLPAFLWKSTRGGLLQVVLK